MKAEHSSMMWLKLAAEIAASKEYQGWTCPKCGTVLRITFTEYGDQRSRLKFGLILSCPNCREALSCDGDIPIPEWWNEQYGL